MAESDTHYETSWSINLEKPRHGRDGAAVLAEAIDVVQRTAAGTHVNLVTHEAHGDPRGTSSGTWPSHSGTKPTGNSSSAVAVVAT